MCIRDRSYPKQFLNLDSNSTNSLLQKTQERILNIENIINPILVCNEEHRFIVAEQMREINVKPLAIILEPFGRNTAPAITLACLKAIENIEDPILLVLSSDHLIKNEKEFTNVLNEGIKFALKDKLVTFGVIPSSPETGYGYIKSKVPFDQKRNKASEIEMFIEKPDINKANELIKDKHYTWNSGIFMFKAKKLVSELEKFSPKILKSCIDAIEKCTYDLDFVRPNKDLFKSCPSLSFDIAVMEKTKSGMVLPLDVKWTDIGNWKALWESSKKDIEGNFKKGKIITNASKNCYLRSENRLIVGIGISNLVIVETNDAVLVLSLIHI